MLRESARGNSNAVIPKPMCQAGVPGSRLPVSCGSMASRISVNGGCTAVCARIWARILNCSVGCSVVQGQVERCGRCCGGFGLSLAVFACQHLNSFGKGLAVKLHDEINGIAALALAVAKPLVSPDGQTVMFFPAVFSSAFYQCLSLCAEKIFQTDGVCPVNLRLGVIHRDSSSFFCRVWGRFWSFCSSVRSLKRAAVSTHDLTFQRRCKSSLTALNSP